MLRGLIITVGLAVGTAGCASTGGTPQPFPQPGLRTTPPTPPSTGTPAPRPDAPEHTQTLPGEATLGASASGLGYTIAGTALALRGTRYRTGGSDPAGFDCSGLVRYVYAQNGVRVPRTVAEQFHAGRAVDLTTIQAGDLVFFTTVSKGASHVGVAIGGDEFVHAPSGAGEVRVERLSAPYWSTRFVGARRIL